MKKISLILLCLLFNLLLTAREKGEQDKLASASFIFISDSQLFGVNLQTMFPIGSNFYIAPEFTYFFPNSESYSFPQYYYKSTTQAININADFHYPLYTGKRSFISPLLGFGGYVTYLNEKGADSDYNYNFNQSGSIFFANIGIAGKFSIANNLFINTQIKYLRPLQEGNGVVTLSAGLGFYF